MAAAWRDIGQREADGGQGMAGGVPALPAGPAGSGDHGRPERGAARPGLVMEALPAADTGVAGGERLDRRSSPSFERRLSEFKASSGRSWSCTSNHSSIPGLNIRDTDPMVALTLMASTNFGRNLPSRTITIKNGGYFATEGYDGNLAGPDRRNLSFTDRNEQMRLR